LEIALVCDPKYKESMPQAEVRPFEDLPIAPPEDMFNEGDESKCATHDLSWWIPANDIPFTGPVSFSVYGQDIDSLRAGATEDVGTGPIWFVLSCRPADKRKTSHKDEVRWLLELKTDPAC
jgi:hypothetical protein